MKSLSLLVFSQKRNPPKDLDRVAIWDEKNEQVIQVITNQMSWTANTISELYKARWKVEIFIQRNKTIASYQIVYRDKRKRCDDPGLDSTYRHTSPKGSESNG